MMEIVFGNSACAGLRAAQRFGDGPYRRSVSAFISYGDGSEPTQAQIDAANREAREKDRQDWEAAAPMGGTDEDVFGFELALSIGDISQEEPGALRKKVLDRIYAYPDGAERQRVREIIGRVGGDLAAIRERALAGESIRIWYSNHPDEMCGLYWFLEHIDRLGALDGEMFVVKLREWEADARGNILQRFSWNEIGAHEWHHHIDDQRRITPAFRSACAHHWRELMAENAPLRAMLNGRLVGAVETIYDAYIQRAIDRQDDVFEEGMVIGRVFTDFQCGIGFAWIEDRIEEMIRAGALEVVAEAEGDVPGYHRILRKRALG